MTILKIVVEAAICNLVPRKFGCTALNFLILHSAAFYYISLFFSYFRNLEFTMEDLSL